MLRPTASDPTGLAYSRLTGALRELGYVEGQNLVIEARYANGQVERLPALARELVQQRVDLLVAVGTGAARAARDATATIPILLLGNIDPVALGLVASLARPGGNITGVLISSQGTLADKKLELLREAVPRAGRIALLAPDDANFGVQVQETQRAARALGLALQVVTVRRGDYDAAFAAMGAERAQAVFVGAHTFFVQDRQPIITLALKHKLPTIWEWPEQVEDGGLMAYGADLDVIYARLAHHADRLLRGARPAELPVEQPSKLELVINLKTARALGLALTQALLLRADRVIE
jgi:putative ABC transport system substrate-binding protein